MSPHEPNAIVIRGAREHNLKNIDVELPRNSLTVVTGLSGSGKSSLAFDTLYAEGQRRYVESLSAYARQFLGLMEKPNVEIIEGLSPAISIEQKATSRNPRSTVATVTEIYDYLRLLFARVGTIYCPGCGKRIERQTVQQITDAVMTMPVDTRIQVLAPVVRGRKGEYKKQFQEIERDGFVRVRVDGEIFPVNEVPALDKRKKHTIEIVVDRLVIKPEIHNRLTDSIELALNHGAGLVNILTKEGDEKLYSEKYGCHECNIFFDEPEPRNFSFNSPFGACPECDGLGFSMEIDARRVIPHPQKSVRDGAIATFSSPRESWYFRMLEQVGEHYGFALDVPWHSYTEQQKNVILYGSPEKLDFHWERNSLKGSGTWDYRSKWEGVISNLERRYRQTDSSMIREWIESFMGHVACPTCSGKRLKPESLAVRIQEKNISDISEMSIQDGLHWFESLKLSARDMEISEPILKEVIARLGFLNNVGLDYLTLSRSAASLSGGEAQRIRLATQIGSQLVGVLYILDEPSIGLHQRDNERLIATLERLRDLGNTVIVVEHDRDTIERADWVVDLGPGAGRHGGQVVAAGTPAQVKEVDESLTGRFLSGKDKIELPKERRSPNKKFLTIKGASGHNLKGVDAKIPLGVMTVVTGVSGSGKSSLINETLYPALAREVYGSREVPLEHNDIEGLKWIDKVVDIDQSPIGRTPRSNPATYTGLFTFMRDLFAQLPEARARGYAPGRFSFNVKGGRCEACQGDGIIKIEMHFLPDVYVTCETCHGKRYNRETLEIKYRGKSIADVLDMTVEEALKFFDAIPSLKRKLKILNDVGLGYIHLGQQATTLSGGEAQRVKLASELSKVATGKTVYILDEPTTGLHFADVKLLLNVIQKLVDRGNTVIIIEHNLDVIKTADWIIDLGPEGGDKGGVIVAEGTPEKVASVKKSHTGRFLRAELEIKD
ncbi:excinuclease ABC subunit UvrA [bacterium]|nr:excinuclease ABC subunit UvrA [bacterium]